MRNPELGEAIKRGWKARYFARHEFANELGVSDNTVYMWERGREPEGWHLLAVVKILNLDADEVMESLKKTHRQAVEKRRQKVGGGDGPPRKDRPPRRGK